MKYSLHKLSDFNPRSSCEERHQVREEARRVCKDFNPRSSCEERRVRLLSQVCRYKISIHAPHARSDTATHTTSTERDCISIHAPHARSDDG